MTVLRIKGNKELNGKVAISGSKNAGLALLSAVILGDGNFIFENVPQIKDIKHKLGLLELLGAKYAWNGSSLDVDCTEIISDDEEKANIPQTRTSFNLLGPLVARTGKAVIPTPGGCNIGARPVDFHLKGLAALGIDIELKNGHYHAFTDRLKGAEIYLDFPSTGATQHLMSTACLAEGTTIIHNAALEPEIITLSEFLNKRGARVEGAGTSTITITGVTSLDGCTYRVLPDRLQASTFLIAGAITRGDVTVEGILPEHLTAITNKLKETEAKISEGPDWVRIQAPEKLKGIKVKTMPYPGFPTDIQQPTAALLATAKGTSIVEETIYEGRIGHIAELNRMGAKITLEGRASVIEGSKNINGATVEASDLRAGAALCLAGLAATGETIVKNVHLIDRGYEDFEYHLNSLGADIERIELDNSPKAEKLASSSQSSENSS